jgi:hypothetical protein
VFFSLWDRWKGLFVQPPFFLSLFFFSLHLDGHIRFFCPPPLSLFLLFIFSFVSSCWNRWEIFLSSPLSLSCFFSFFFISLCWDGGRFFSLAPCLFSFLFLFLRQQCHIFMKNNIFLCNKVTQSCSKESARALQDAFFFGVDTQNQPDCKLKVKGFCIIGCCTCTPLCVLL